MQARRKNFRVLLTALNYSPEPTGIAPYATDLAEYLQREGQCSVSVVTSHPHYPEWRVRTGYGQWKTTNTDESGLEIHRLKHFVPASPTDFKRLISELTFAVRLLFTRWSKPDLIITVSPSLISSSFAVVKAKLIGRPIVIWSQDLYATGLSERTKGPLSSIASSLLKRLESFTYRNSTEVVVIHERFAGTISTHLRVDSRKTHIIRNWTRVRPLAVSNRNATRRTLGWSDYFVVVHSGAQGKKQGLESFVDLAGSVRTQLPDVRWILIGDGSQRGMIEAAASSVDTVEVWDPLPGPEFLRVLSAADAFLVCEAEGVAEAAVPSKLTTYFSAGAPTIGILDPRSITWSEIHSAGAGLTIGHSAEQLSEAVRSLIDDPDSAQEMAQSGIRFCEHNLSRSKSLTDFALLARGIIERTANNMDSKNPRETG